MLDIIRTVVLRPKLVLSIAAFASIAQAQSVDFGRDVQPILSDRCFACHGPDAANRTANLRLDMRDGALSVITPGDPDGSKLIARIESEDPARRMPPAYMGHEALSAAEVDVLRRWVADGANYRRHWAFEPPRRTSPPQSKLSEWARDPLDAFVAARLEKEGLSPSAEAAPETWLRRMMLDLVGLPPLPEDVDEFLNDVAARGEEAYRAAVDRTLASPHYGERLAMDWLDVARYADTHGFNNDSERSMWRWRDWVIEAFNRNLPYDRFIVEQLAGDLLEQPTLDQVIATGFNRNHVINSEGGIIDEEYRVEYVADRVRTLGMAWLGLTVECARCHDHKFDPVSQKDYYRLFAFFNNVPELGEAGRANNAVPFIQAPTREQHAELDDLRAGIRRLEDGPTPQPDAKALRRIQRKRGKRPKKRAFREDCKRGEESGPGGAACAAGGQPIRLKRAIKLDGRARFSAALWFRADSEQPDAPLLSAIDYAPDPASAQHGSGIEMRLVGEEIEVRMSKRYPSYSITVQSRGAGIRPSQWRHAAVVYEGAPRKSYMRAGAAWLRLFVDGREVGTRILHDDLQDPGARFEKTIRLGADNQPEPGTFDGALDSVRVWARPLRASEVRAEFEADALPWALDSEREPSTLEREWVRRAADPSMELERLRTRLFALERRLPTTMVMAESETLRQAYVLNRGMYDQPGETVEPGVPEAVLGTWPDGAPKNRLGLAVWLTRPDHPTTARVVVNRFWQHLFGTGLVKTAGDFGLQGEAPSHPRLLDTLAVDFVQSGWNVKALLKRIVLSATYRQDSAAAGTLIENDPENRLLARGPRFRLPAEVIRDQALQLAGLLSSRIGGPSVRPYQPDGLYEGVIVGAAYPGTVWRQDHGENLYRRSLYTYWKRTLPHPTMTVFDAPDREFCTVQRSRTNTPLQALTLMNDPTFVEAARKIAERTAAEVGVDARLGAMFRLAAGREADRKELTVLRRAFDELLESYEAAQDGAEALLEVGASDAAEKTPELAAYASVAAMILNLDEVMTKG